MNVEMMLAVAHEIETHNRFRLSTWAAREYGEFDDSITADDVLHDCSTTACVAGWTNALTGHSPCNSYQAQTTLGLNPEQSSELFTPHLDEYPSVWRHVVADPNEATATDAARLLRMLVAGEIGFDCDRQVVSS